MKNFALIMVIFCCFWSCNTENTDGEKSEKAVVETSEKSLLSEEEACFLFTDGTENQDSTFVSLKIVGDSVTGYMHWQPWQVDGAYGKITAVKTDSVIRGMYDYTIEGFAQKEEVMFKISNDKLYKASGELTEDLGEEVVLKLKNPENVIYKYEFRKIDCQLFEKF